VLNMTSAQWVHRRVDRSIRQDFTPFNEIKKRKKEKGEKRRGSYKKKDED
jgi:hypothetical protein